MLDFINFFDLNYLTIFRFAKDTTFNRSRLSRGEFYGKLSRGDGFGYMYPKFEYMYPRLGILGSHYPIELFTFEIFLKSKTFFCLLCKIGISTHCIMRPRQIILWKKIPNIIYIYKLFICCRNYKTWLYYLYWKNLGM